MKNILGCMAIAAGLSGCFPSDGGDKDEAPLAGQAHVQEWTFLSSIDSAEMRMDGGHCGEDSDPLPVKYRIRGDSLDLGWAYMPWTLDPETGGIVVTDTLWIGGTYTRQSPGSSVQGTWKLRTHHPWDARAAASLEAQLEIERWNFIYADEEISIGPKIILYAYPRLWLYSTRTAEYDHREDESVKFRYVGGDSLRITRKSGTVSLRHKPLDVFRAHFSTSAHASLSVSLADSCASASTIVDTTWVGDFIWGNDEEEVLKRNLFSHSTRAGVRARGRGR